MVQWTGVCLPSHVICGVVKTKLEWPMDKVDEKLECGKERTNWRMKKSM
jgi:hypothetical protein